ncbi:LacI family DNA-binding transcriptional regulator [Nocardia gipuzkoensis]|uniref:LacI family DNA-binding transcriptional regulator n=1 Tax=Nocardia gipuzkoensis TaxID=2749991 RepID=UPI00237D49D7|nr:LacI family DNA-binding transcriptional regulator [Nocardia gipuzkoensis]MDE1675319.1 LacI family DNA-binding transcriptional regulator [Nocardia gipuzkoensis]
MKVSAARLCSWRRQYGMDTARLELTELREQNARLERLLAEAELDKGGLRENAKRNGEFGGRSPRRGHAQGRDGLVAMLIGSKISRYDPGCRRARSDLASHFGGAMRRPARPSAVRPTMKAIADQVGVSIKSVSRVLNGEGGTSPETASRILAAAEELGFRRNELARGLRQGSRTDTIGLVLKESSSRFFDSLIRGIEEVAEQHELLVLTAASRTPDREKATLLALSARRVDGLLIVPASFDQSYLRPEQAAGLPLVFIDRPPVGVAADAVLSDGFGGGYAAVAHLLENGHRRIGVIGESASLYTISERMRGYHAAFQTHRLHVDNRLIRLDKEGAAAAKAASDELLDMTDPPTALFTLNNKCTLGAIRSLRERGLNNTRALVGFDDFDTADLLDPPLTIVAPDITAMGRIATERLLARINGDNSGPQVGTLPISITCRGSGEIAPA